MGSVDRISQLKITKQFVRLCKQGKIYSTNSTNSSQSRITSASSTSPPFGTEPGLIHLNSHNNCPILLEDFLKRKNGFTLLEPPVDESPKFEKLRILELENKWKYWIPTKHVKISSEDIVFSQPSIGLNLPKIIPLPPHASSSFSKEEMLKLCKRVHFGNEQIVYHEKRKLPKEVKTGNDELSPKELQEKIESHLSPGELRKTSSLESLSLFSNNGRPKGPHNTILTDCILLFSQNKSSPELQFSPGKKCSRERLTHIANCINTEINSLGISGVTTDFSIYDPNVQLVMAKLSGRRVLARDLKQYKLWYGGLRSWLATKMEVIPSILKLQPEIEKGKVTVRWRVKTLTTFFALTVLLKDKESQYSYLDFYSEFFVNEQGLIHSHVLSKIEPTSSGEKVSKTAKLSTLAAGIFGLSGLENPAFVSTPDFFTSLNPNLPNTNVEMGATKTEERTDEKCCACEST